MAGSCLAGMAVLAQPAMAQDSATAEANNANANDRGIQDIVVTARYVAESIQDTPIAITAQTNEQLQAANVTQMSELGAVVPNMQTVPGDSMQAGSPTIKIRSVAQGGSSLAVPPAVGIYTDDVYHSTTAGSELDFTDVARVEVNRGPQSTLSGNASMAGSIRIFTHDPVGDGSGFVSLGYGSRKHFDASGAIDLGITPTLAVRALGHLERQTGFANQLDFSCMMDKLGTPELAGTLPYFQPDSAQRGCVLGHLGGGDKAYGQVKLQWKPVDNVRLLITASHRENNLEETPEVALAYAGGCVNPIPGQYPDGIGPQPCAVTATNQVFALAAYNSYGLLLDNRFLVPERDGGRYDSYATFCRPKIDLTAAVPSLTPDAPPTVFDGFQDGLCYAPRKTEQHTLLSGKLEVGLTDNINMTAIGSYTDYSNEFTQAADASPLGASISHFMNLDKMHSGELRFDGKTFNDKLTWVLGGFAVKTDGYQNNYISYGNTQQINSVHGINKSQSLFAHLDFNITDQWRVSGGGRYTYTDIAITIDNPSAVSVTVPAHSTQKVWDWLLSTDYKIGEHALIYATAASGSRPGGLTTIIANARQLSNTPSESLISYEAGLKADFFDRRLRTNLTAFYIDYKQLSTSAQGTQCANEPGTGQATYYNVQFDTPEANEQCSKFPGNPIPIRYYNNVGIPASVKGIEWEITAAPADGLKLDWTGGYNHFKSSVQTLGQPGYTFPGNLRQPEWNMHADVSYEIETDAGSFTPRLDWTWQSKQTYDPSSSVRAPDPLFVINPYSIWNAQIVYKTPSRDWTATLAVTNLANKYYNYIVYKGSVDTYARVAPPREVMFTVRREF